MLLISYPPDSIECEPPLPGTPKFLRTPRTPRTPAHFQSPPPVPPASASKSKATSRLDANAPAFVPRGSASPVPRGSASPLPTPQDDDSEGEKAAIRARILSAFDRNANTSDSSGDSHDGDNLNLEYVQLKMRLADIKSGRQGTESDVKGLQARLEEVKNSYFFDQRDAEEQYRIERKKVDALYLQSRLRGSVPAAESTLNSKPAKTRPPNLQQVPAATSLPAVDIFDEDSEDSVGVLGILEDMPQTETTAQGTIVTVRDMALPKHWSGRTPKTLLAETVAKLDRYAVITYNILSGASRAKRASVNIRWEGRKTDDWSMEDIACHDEGQAEQYISTVALHALTFPSTEGFAAGATAAASTQATFFRLFPAVFRDLWDELESARKAKDDAINRAVWAKLRAIVEPKLVSSGKVGFSYFLFVVTYVQQVNGKHPKQVMEPKENVVTRVFDHANEGLSDRLMTGFRARVHSPTYQEMLVRLLLPL